MRSDFYGTMDIYARYFELPRFFLILIGQWPYESAVGNTRKRTFIACFVLSLIIAHICKFFTAEITLDFCVDIIPPLLLSVISMTKYLGCCVNSKLLKYVLERMKTEWADLTEEDEIKIFQGAGETAKFYAFCIASFCMAGTIVFMSTQYIPCTLDLIAPLNQSRPKVHLLLAEYFVDEQEHFYKIVAHMQIAMLLAITVIIGTDSMAISVFVHISGMFTLTGHRLAHAFDQDTGKYRGTDKTVLFCSRIVRAVDYHRKTLELAQFIMDSWKPYYLVQLILIIIILTGLLLQLHLELIKMENMDLIVLGIFRLLGHFLVLFFNILPAQKILDCSSNIFTDAYCSDWYSAPVRAQKMLLFVIRRTMEPCRLTAYSIISMSFEILTSILQLTFSYFTLIHSMQE